MLQLQLPILNIFISLCHHLRHRYIHTSFLLQDCTAAVEFSSALPDSCGYEGRTSSSPVTYLQGNHTRLLLRWYVLTFLHNSLLGFVGKEHVKCHFQHNTCIAMYSMVYGVNNILWLPGLLMSNLRHCSYILLDCIAMQAISACLLSDPVN